MNLRLLLDGIVRQTTVLLAQVSTAAGVRAPLAHVADQIFLDLAREIEAQGVGRKVVADMFGMALRSYQKKMQRLAESATERNRTLWLAVLEFLQGESKTRARILQRFDHDGEREVAAVLSDLVSSGLVYSTGRGGTAVYGLTTEADRTELMGDHDVRAVANIVWLLVFLREATTEDAIATRLGIDPPLVKSAVEDLLLDGRLQRSAAGELEASNVLIPVGSDAGWEAAVLDHFRAVATAIATKIERGPATKGADEVGGTTFTFSVYAGHPHEAKVRGLLAQMRREVSALWNEVAAHNRNEPVPEDAARVTFYFGQSVTEPDEADKEAGP